MADEQNIYGIKYEVDISQLKMSTSEASKQIRLANSEFNKSASSLDDWATSVDGLTAKVDQMNSILQAEKSKLAQSQKEYNNIIDKISDYGDQIEEANKQKEKLIATYGKESKEVKNASVTIAKLTREQDSLKNKADSLRTSINNQTATVNRTEKAMDGYKDQLEEVKQAQANAEKSGRSLEDELKDLKKANEELSDSVDNSNDGFSVLKGTLANLIATGISNFIGGIQSAVEETRELRKEFGMLEATAKTTGSSFETAKNNLKEINSITGDTGAGVEGLNNLLSAGFDGKVLDQITDELLGASIKWKDTLKFEGLSDGLQETLATGSAIGPFAELIDRAGGDIESFDKGLKKAIKSGNEQNYVLDYLAKFGLSDVKTAYEEANGTLIDSANATYEYNEAMSQLAEKSEPVFTAIKSGFASVLGAILTETEGFDTGALADKISDGFEYFVDEVIPKVIEGFQFISEHGSLIISVLAGISAGFVAFNVATTIASLVGVFKTLFTSLKAGDGIMKALNLTMKANPYVLIASLIAALVVAFITLWNTSEEFRNFWINLWKGIQKTTDTVVKAIVKFFTETIPNGIKSALSWFDESYKKVTTWGSNMIKKAKETGVNFAKGILDKFKELPGDIVSVGSDLVKGLWNGINDMAGWVKKKIKGFSDGVLDGIKDFFGVESPSKETAWIGKMLDEGLAMGITKNAGNVVKQASKMANNVLSVMRNNLDSMALNLNAGGLSSGYALANNKTSSGVVNNVTFNQYNTSPEALDSTEVYKNTRKQLQQLKVWELGGVN